MENNKYVTCPKCGKKMSKEDKFCGNCGNKMIKANVTKDKKATKLSIGILIGLVFFIFTIEALISSGFGKKNTGEITDSNLTPSTIVSYDFNSYAEGYDDLTDVQKDEFIKSHEGDLVQWSGYISNVYDDHIALKINKDDYMGRILCYYDQSQKNVFKDLNKDNAVTVRGHFYDKSINWRVINCELINE